MAAASQFDFFAQQELARRNTWRLVGLYAVAALAVVASYCLLAALPHWIFGRAAPRPLLAGVAAATTALILGVSAYRAWQLSEGGSAIAWLLGAAYVDPWKCSPAERRLLNVVEEMSIASGITVPPVYVLRRDDAVNALVAGHSPNEAVIIVTQGALDKLSRDELQAVMGHEYSHILNGDMALNLRLACVLAGLGWLGERGEEMVWEAAQRMRRSGTGKDDQTPAAVPAFAGALLAFVGFPGVFAAGALRAAIAREREFLADQASVQFTRNPDGMAGALDSIYATHSHTQVSAPHAAELAHMFFAPVASHWWTFPTHPPIADRIRRVHPRFDRDSYRERRHGTRREVAVIDGSGAVVKTVRAGTPLPVGAPTAEHVDYAVQLLRSLPERTREALRQAQGARETMLALARGGEVAGVPRHHMLTLAELAVPAIRDQPQKARDAFLAEVAEAVQADGRVTLSEFILLTFLRQRLREGAGQPIPTEFRELGEVAGDVRAILSLVALAAGSGAPAAYARAAAVVKLELGALLTAQELDMRRVGEALERLRRLAPFAKPALLKACVEASAADGALRLAEAELVRMVAATLDCPVPPLIAARDPGSLAA